MAPLPGLKDPAGLQLVDDVLTNLAIQYRPEGHIYDQIVTDIPVRKDEGVYPVWNREDFLRDDVESAVADRAETPEIDFGYSTRPYLLRNRRLKVTVTEDERSQAHSALRFEQAKVNGLLDRFAIQRERRLARILRKTTNGGSLTYGGTVATKWDAATGVTIERDIKAARKAVYDGTGQHVNTIIMGWDVAYAIALDPSIREIIKYTGDGQAIIRNGEKLLPSVLHGLNVVVADGDKYNAAREGAAESLQSIWSDNVRLIKRGPANSWGQPATLYGLRGDVGNNAASRNTSANDGPRDLLVDRWLVPDPPVENIRAWEKRQEQVVAADIGYEIADVLT